MRRTRTLVPLLACIASIAVVAASCGGKSGHSTASAPSTGAPTAAPEPPRPVVAPGTVTGKSAEYSRVFAEAEDETERLAAALGAFTDAELMVLYGGGSVTVSPVGQTGIPWSSVWSGTLATTPGTAVPLDQLGRAFVSYFRQPLEPLLATLMSDLRTGLAGDAFVARLVASDARRYGGVDLAAPATPSSAVYVSAPTLFIVGASLVQAMAAHLAPAPPVTGTGSTGASVRPASLRALPDGYQPFAGSAGAPPLLGEDCGTGAGNGWVQFVGTKVMGGFKAPGMAWDGVVGKTVGEAGSAKLEKALAPANAFLSILSAIVQYGALKANAEAKPLERTRSSNQPGKETNIDVTVFYDLKHSKEANKAFNCIQAALGVMGIGTSLPTSGPVGGADVEFSERKGFGAGGWVQWWGNNQHMTTDGNGKTFQTVAGQKQPADVPSTAKSLERTYSVDIKVALDPDNEDSLNKFTIDGVACAGSIIAPGFGGAAMGCLDMAMDMLKQVNFSLGERTFSGTDWTTGYRVSSTRGFPMLTMEGRSCAQDNPERGPWTITYFSDLPGLDRHSGPPLQLDFTGSSSVPFSIRLEGPDAEYYRWEGTGTANLVNESGSGWQIVFTDVDFAFRSDVAGMSMGGLPGAVIMPDLPLQPASDCPTS